jgi:hypothetical protein
METGLSNNWFSFIGKLYNLINGSALRKLDYLINGSALGKLYYLINGLALWKLTVRHFHHTVT